VDILRDRGAGIDYRDREVKTGGLADQADMWPEAQLVVKCNTKSVKCLKQFQTVAQEKDGASSEGRMASKFLIFNWRKILFNQDCTLDKQSDN